MHAELAAFFAARAAIGSADHTCTDGCSCGIQLSLRLSLPVDVRAACLLLSLFAFVLVIALTCVTTFPEYSGCTLVLFPLIARCISFKERKFHIVPLYNGYINVILFNSERAMIVPCGKGYFIGARAPYVRICVGFRSRAARA